LGFAVLALFKCSTVAVTTVMCSVYVILRTVYGEVEEFCGITNLDPTKMFLFTKWKLMKKCGENTGLKITAGQWPDRWPFKTIFDRTFLIFWWTFDRSSAYFGRYFEPCSILPLPDFIPWMPGLVSPTLYQSPKESIFRVIAPTFLKHLGVVLIDTSIQMSKEMYEKVWMICPNIKHL